MSGIPFRLASESIPLSGLWAHARYWVDDSLSSKRYSPACTRLLSQYKTMLKLVGDAVPSVEDFMTRYRVRMLSERKLLVDTHSAIGCWIDGSPCCTTSAESGRTSNCWTFQRGRCGDGKVGGWNDPGSFFFETYPHSDSYYVLTEFYNLHGRA